MTLTEPQIFEHSLGQRRETAELVFLHGWGQSHKSLLPLAATLETRHHCRLFDLPGFGQTPMLAAGAGTADYAAHLGAVLEGPDGKDDAARVIVGHSFGCRVAIRFACRWPDRVDALVLIAAAGLKRKRSLRFRLRAMLLRWLGKFYGVIDAVFRTDTKAAYREKFGSTDYKNAGELRATFVTTINEDLSELAGQLRCPVLLIYGSDDSETPVELGERYEKLIPNATLKVLDHFAHLDILGAGRQQMATLIRRFLGE